MTVLTRAGRAFFRRRGQPGSTRTFLRQRSAAWRHFDELSTSTVWCGSCGFWTEKPMPAHIAVPTIAKTEKHRIGTAWIDGVAHAKWCDGTETPE